MRNLLRFALLFVFSCAAVAADNADITRWKTEATHVTITRDDWGIAHVVGNTDADAVFGMIYAQCEDDFNRVETNYINALGRLAESEGESKIYQDLRQKLFMDPEVLKKQYGESPDWLKKLMDAFADGANFYLYKHPEVKPLVITRFEPWMAMSFTEGSIGGDIERVNLRELGAFYGKNDKNVAQLVPAEDYDAPEPEPSGSNGIAIAPSNTTNHHALLLINPHTSFFFRSELQMTSHEGLNAYGAVTWGQFFIYQGFNDHTGWMHTSSGVDAVDDYVEQVSKSGGHYVYKYGSEERPVKERIIHVPYKTDHGMADKTFTAYFTSHGPVIREADGKWITIQLMQRPIEALEQSYLRTKTANYAAYRKTMDLQANSSNNTIFADSDGDIAYFHGNFIPKRNDKYDYTKPVDGSNPDTDWHGLLTVDETPHLLNPKSGWLYNSNNWPWSGAGESSLKKEDFPAYVETGGESARGLHAIRLLTNKKDFTADSLRTSAYDSYLPWFEKTIPALVKAWEQDSDAQQKSALADQVALLRKWDFRWGVDSVPTSLAVFWGEDITRAMAKQRRRRGGIGYDDVAAAQPQMMLASLAAATDKLKSDFGKWQTPWGEINRFQRVNGDIVQPFNDSLPSIPVEFTSSMWGSLASFGAHAYPGTKKWYGTSGNSFVAVVEFGPQVHAVAVTAGGESGHPNSKHFNDEAERYSTGNLREVYFYPAQLKGHTEKQYRPGE
jgi:acyl-homoserine-lactone acylase